MLRLLVLLISCFISSSVLSNTIQQLESEINKQQYSRAAKTGLTMLRQQPQNIQAQFLTAVAFQNNNQPSIAQRYYLQIIQSNPELPEPRNNLAMIYIDQGKYDQAIDLLITSLKTHPAYATAWQNLNLLYQGLASEAYRKALSKEKNPRSVMGKIKLSALTSLHNVNDLTIIQPAQPAKTIQVASAPIVKTEPAKTKKPPKVTKEQLIKPLQDWAKAWRQKNFKNYTKAYSKGYKGGKASHQTWVNYRRSRILKPGSIQVKLSNFQIKSQSSTRAIIDFHQSFKSPTYKDKVVKRIQLTKIGDSWKITKESTIAVL